MSVGVVDLFEMVDVENNDGRGALQASGPLEQRPAIEQSGERICFRIPLMAARNPDLAQRER